MSQRSAALVAICSVLVLFLVAGTKKDEQAKYKAQPLSHYVPEIKQLEYEKQERKARKDYKMRQIKLRAEQREKEAEAKRKEQERRAFHLAFEIEIAKECNSNAIFKKSLWQWRVFVPELGSLPVSIVYPKTKNRLIRAIEEIGAGDDVTFKELCRAYRDG